MARVLPPPLLLLLLVKLNSGSSSSLVQPDCTDGSTPVEKGNSAVVYEGLAEKEKDLTIKLYVWVAEDFKGVTLEVTGKSGGNTANPGEVGNAQYVTENDLYESLDYCKDRSLNDNNTKGNAANPGEAGNAQHVTENDLYESFEYHIKDHSLHGKFDNNTKVGFSPVKREAPYTTENELYESFSSCGHRYDQ
ncbi:uncharacterized protein LOC135098066 isoform X4 [Scylla paramamosain]|uniref:uncharacterized protein LOC135098066 isoform X4 n=1 Tax=Scylla paramamosain TaxID=85552 RepID=UPI00308315C7